VDGYAGVRADAVLLHQPDELTLGEVVGRRGLPLGHSDRADVQLVALSEAGHLPRVDLLPGHQLCPAEAERVLARAAEFLAVDADGDGELFVRGVGAQRGDEEAANEVVHLPRLAAQLFVRGVGCRRYGWMVAHVLKRVCYGI